MLEIEERRG